MKPQTSTKSIKSKDSKDDIAQFEKDLIDIHEKH